jgi:hypothetical protein
MEYQSTCSIITSEHNSFKSCCDIAANFGFSVRNNNNNNNNLGLSDHTRW